MRRSVITAAVVTLGMAAAVVPAQADVSTYTVTGYIVDPQLGLYPYTPIENGTDLPGNDEGDSDDCEINGWEINGEGGVDVGYAHGCGGVNLTVSFRDQNYSDDAGNQGDGTVYPTATATVARVYGCVSVKSRRERATLVRVGTARFNAGFYGALYSATPAPLMSWIAPLEHVTCKAGENPAELAIGVGRIKVAVVDADQGDKIVQNFPTARGIWFTTRSHGSGSIGAQNAVKAALR